MKIKKSFILIIILFLGLSLFSCSLSGLTEQYSKFSSSNYTEPEIETKLSQTENKDTISQESEPVKSEETSKKLQKLK